MKTLNKAGSRKKVIFSLFVSGLCFAMLLIFPFAAAAETYTTVYTPNGTAVTGAVLSELTPADIRDINSMQQSRFPYAYKIREPTRRYNCHSYAWHSQSANNTVWIDYGDFLNEHEKYWQDGSYVAITTVTGDINVIPYAAPVGSKVFYNNGDHSAIKEGTHTFVSKWGKMGLYEHIPDDCPYVSDSVTYYKRNK